MYSKEERLTATIEYCAHERALIPSSLLNLWTELSLIFTSSVKFVLIISMTHLFKDLMAQHLSWSTFQGI